MRREVQSWDPPTPEHERVKEYALAILDEAIQGHDCQLLEIPEQMTGQEFKARELEHARSMFERAEVAYDEERATVRHRNEWGRKLRENLAEQGAEAQVVT